jgi:diguanylate cyclase (GGDEF)-like protein/PAS domain S-box-containing protein
MPAVIPSKPKLRPFATWSLKTKFALCSGALMGVFSIAFTTWTLRNVEVDVYSSVVDAQRALVRATAADIDAKVDLRQDAMLTIAALLGKAAPAPGTAMEDFFLPRPVLKKMFDLVVVVDADGVVNYEFPSGAASSSLGNDLREFDFFKRVKAGQPMVISSPFKSLAGDRPYVAFAAPLRASDGRFKGALVGLLNLSHGNFIGDLGKERIGKDGYFVLVERTDMPLLVLHRQSELIATPAPGGSSHPIIVGARQGHEGVVEGSSTFGGPALRSYKPLRSVPWVLVALYPTEEAFAGLAARKREVMAVGAAFFVLASAAAWLLTRWLLQPLGRLQTVIARHASEPGLQIEAESFGSAELAALVKAYNAQALARREFEDRLHASEKRVREIADNMPASIAYIDKDERYTFANARVFSQIGNGDEQIIGSTMRRLRGDASYAEIAPYVAQALGGQTVNFETREFVQGHGRHSQFHFIPDRDESGQVRGFYKMIFDITALKEAQGRQALVEQRLRAITDRLPALIAHLDKAERYDFLNDTFKVWLGIDPADSIGKRMAEVIGSEAYATRRAEVARCLAGAASSFETDVQTLVGRKTLRTEYLPDFETDGSIAGFYIFSSDVTELKDVQLRLSKLVRSDSLTGLYNRRQFEESLPLALARSRRSGLRMALMFLDVDHFKRINDGHGHDVGDQILKEFAWRLSGCLRSTDTVARLGGDEFVVILEGLHAEDEAERVGKNIVDEIGKPFAMGGSFLDVTTSIGIAFGPNAEATETAQALLKRADAALYVAKTAGRNGYHLSRG